MPLSQFARARRAVSHYLQTEVLKKDFRELPVFLKLLIQLNKHSTSAVLQTEQGNNSFLQFFMGFPISLELGKLTMDVLVANCFHYKTPSYDGVCMNIVTRTGFGRTILGAIAAIPIENSNHICWVLQMCLRHGLDLRCAIFTDQGPMLAAAALFNEHFQILLKLQLCLQHIIRCIRRLHPALFQTKKDNTRSLPASGENKSKATKNTGNFNDRTVRKMVHKASYATSCSEFFGIIYDSIQLLVVRNSALCGDIMDV